jgi:hypothetical protein
MPARNNVRYKAHKDSGEIELAIVGPSGMELATSGRIPLEEAEKFVRELAEAIITVAATRRKAPPKIILPQPVN